MSDDDEKLLKNRRSRGTARAASGDTTYIHTLRPALSRETSKVRDSRRRSIVYECARTRARPANRSPWSISAEIEMPSLRWNSAIKLSFPLFFLVCSSPVLHFTALLMPPRNYLHGFFDYFDVLTAAAPPIRWSAREAIKLPFLVFSFRGERSHRPAAVICRSPSALSASLALYAAVLQVGFNTPKADGPAQSRDSGWGGLRSHVIDYYYCSAAVTRRLLCCSSKRTSPRTSVPFRSREKMIS